MHDSYDEATKVNAVDGEVQLDGPDGVAVSMTPEAASETSDRLFSAAAEAKGQQMMREAGADLRNADEE